METKFLASVIKTFKQVFPHVYPFKHFHGGGEVGQNWTLLASLSPWDLGLDKNQLFQFYDPRVFEAADTLVFSDEFTPRSLVP